ncbi:MAG: protoheme IX farnesyltransferase [Gemmatimonadales bacterium]|nr:MAG: protoheme IX farnesyltransferase [Gemmatimonadales bacterium]
MSETTVQARPSTNRVRAYYELTKPGIAVFVMMTAGVSFYVGAAGMIVLLPLVHTLIGTVVATAGALALNQYIEREVDARMKRTRNRPLPSQRLAPLEALVFGLLLIVAGCVHLWITVGGLPALLTLASAVVYNFVYTPLKSRSYLATFAGAFPGAMPALIGWSAATGGVSLGALVLFAIAFLWQLPHVLALAWLLRADYGRAGFYLSPPDPEGRLIGGKMVLYSAILIPVSLAPTLIGITGWIYFGGAIVLGLAVLWWSIQALGDMQKSGAVRKVFLSSLAYQPLLLALMALDTVRPG